MGDPAEATGDGSVRRDIPRLFHFAHCAAGGA
jgi:hypothetical protein